MPSLRRRSIAAEAFGDCSDIEVGWIGIVERTGITFFQMTNQVGVEHTGPSDTALKKGKLKCRKPPRHAAQKQRLTNRLSGGGKMTDVIVNEIGVRNACAKPLRRA